MKHFLTLLLLLCSIAIGIAQQNTLMPNNIDDHWTNLNVNGILVSANTNRSAAATAGVEVNTFTSSGALSSPTFYYSVAGSEMEVRDMSEAPAVQPSAGNQNGTPAGYYLTGALHAAGTTLGAGVASKMFVMRVTAAGAVVWARVRFNLASASTRTDVGVSVVTMLDGEVIAVGNSNFTANGFAITNIIVGRFGVSGGQPWANEYACSCVAGGGTPENPLTAACNLVAREATIDQTGGIATTTTPNPVAVPIAQQGVAITGYYQKAATAVGSLNRTFVMVVNGLGVEMWRNSYPTQGTNTTDEGWDIIQNPSINYEFAVGGQSGTAGNRSIYFLTVSAAGTAMCQNTINVPSPVTDIYARAIIANNNQNAYVLAGPDLGTGNTFFLETAPTCGATPIWMQEYPLTTNHPTAAESIQRNVNTLNSGYFVSTHRLGGNTNYDPHILLTNSIGVTTNCTNNPKIAAIQNTVGFNPLIKCQQVTDFLTQTVSSLAITVPENGCAAVNPNPCPNPNFIARLNATSFSICTGSSFTVTAAGYGGTPAYTYAWAPINPATATLTDTPLVTTIYTVTVTDANGCTATATVTVTVKPIPAISITGTTTICYGSTTTLTASGGISCVWSPSTPGYVNTVGAGTYTATITAANGCTNTQSVTVTATCCLAPTLIATSITCNKFQLTTGGVFSGCNTPLSYTYNYGDGSPPVTMPSNAIIHTYSTVGTYTACVTMTQVCNNVTCSQTVCVTIVVSEVPYVNVVTITANCTTTLTATGGTTSTSGPTTGGTYTWDGPGAVTQTPVVGRVTIAVSGTYTVTFTPSSGPCSSTTIVIVIVPIMPIVSIAASTTTLCPGQCATLTPTGSPTGGTYAWSGGSATPAGINTVCTAGTYTVTYTDTNGCTATASTTLIALQNCCQLLITDLRYNIYSDQRTVNFLTPTLSGCSAGGTITYLWEFGDGTTATTASFNKVYATAGIYNACLTATCTGLNGQICRVKCCRAINIPDPCIASNPTFSVLTPAGGYSYTLIGNINTGALSTYIIKDATGNAIYTSQAVSNNTTHTYSHVFPAAGTYTICRTVSRVANTTNGIYCEVTMCRTITVSAPCNVNARFYARLSSAPPLVVNFYSTSTGASTTEWAYSTSPFGIFTPMSSLISFSYTFPAYNTYWVKITINKGTICEASVIHRIELKQIACVLPVTTASRVLDDATNITSEATLVHEFEANAAPTIQPNPTNGSISVLLNRLSEEETTISIINLQGTLLETQRVYSGTVSLDFDLSAYPSGMYMLTLLTAKGERITHKVIKE
jgi:PKD repeat protein